MSERINVRLLAAHLRPKVQRLLKQIEELVGSELPEQGCTACAAGDDYEVLLSVRWRHRGLFAGQAPPGAVAANGHTGKPAKPSPVEGSASDGLKRIHRKLIEKATDTPVPAKQLLKSAGYDPNTYGRDAITLLTRRGLLVRTPDGVRLPPAPPPAPSAI